MALARALAEVCYCPPPWEALRQRFVHAVAQDSKLPAFTQGLAAVCAETEQKVTRSVERFVDVPFGSQQEVRALARALISEGDCLPGLAAGAYSCLAVSWFEYNYPAMNRFANIAAKLLVFADGCFEPGATRWKITSGHAWRQVRAMIMGEPDVDWAPRSVPLCVEDASDPRDSLIGFCGKQMPHEVRLAVAGPLEPIAEDETVLCTHTSGDALSLVEPMLRSWEGPASVAVYDGPSPRGPAALRGWVRGLREEAGLARVVVSMVGPSRRARTAYDALYPANLLRQAALDAAVGRWVLLADPGFVPSAGFYRGVAPSAALGAALRAVSASAPTAFVVASFVVPAAAPAALAPAEPAALVDAGEAVAFDAAICPLCRPFAWQWLLLQGPPGAAARFQAVEPGDLQHPAWLLERRLLPRLPGFLHGLVLPRSGAAKTGWTALPCGLRPRPSSCAGARRRCCCPAPSCTAARPRRRPRRTGRTWTTGSRCTSSSTSCSGASRRACRRPTGGGLAEVLPARRLAGDVVLLKRGSDPSLTLVVMASTVLASEGLELLLASVPWTVHAVAVGAKDYWAVAMRRLPLFLRALPPETLVAIVDAYDVVLLPCSRSVAEEFAASGKDVLWAADKSCFPNPAVCTSCEERYAEGPELEACRGFPNLNGGCYMGRAPALAHALEWMHWHGAAGGRDDQENKWHYYNRFPERVALDHRQRVFSCFFGCPAEDFRVENCSVVNSHTGEEICIAHANGGTKFEILAPLLRELEGKGCLHLPRARRAQTYAGISYPRFIWW